jgi:hypothetical protein
MARRPLDKRGAEDLFERDELAAHGGQGKTQLTACGRQVPGIRNPDEHPHRRELVHGRIIAKNGKMSRQISGYSSNREAPYCGRWMRREERAMNEIATNFHKLPEVPANTHDELLLWHALHRLEVTYWYDVDFNEGRTAHELFTPDGVKMVGDNRFEGREEIRAFYEWRARQNVATAARKLGISGVRAVRHLIANLYVASSSERRATVRGIVIFYGGKSKLQSNRPTVPDFINECVLNKDNVWRSKSHTIHELRDSSVNGDRSQFPEAPRERTTGSSRRRHG